MSMSEDASLSPRAVDPNRSANVIGYSHQSVNTIPTSSVAATTLASPGPATPASAVSAVASDRQIRSETEPMPGCPTLYHEVPREDDAGGRLRVGAVLGQERREKRGGARKVLLSASAGCVYMSDLQFRRRFLKASLGLGTVAVAGCGARSPSDESPSDQTESDQTQTETDEPSLPELGDDFEKDTSGDGFSDQLLLNAEVFDGADPLRKNVFVEVDYERGIRRESVENRMREIREVFADAPVRNPDGSMGIDVHYVVSNDIAIDGSLTRDEMFAFREEHFDRALKGYFYMVFVENLEEVLGAAAGVAEVMITENTPNTPLHELGHKLGLYGSRPGVDQRRYPFEEYPSVMNYNAPEHALVFADDTAHPEAPNDWAVIERLLPDEQPLTSLL
jgi:hypothetical protein